MHIEAMRYHIYQKTKMNNKLLSAGGDVEIFTLLVGMQILAVWNYSFS